MLKLNAIVASKTRHPVIWSIFVVVLDATAVVVSILLAILLASRFPLIRYTREVEPGRVLIASDVQSKRLDKNVRRF
jgi:hypothetical protein